MDISISHVELRNFASHLNQWASQMRALRTQVLSNVQSLETHWRDPQYAVFLETARSHAANLKLTTDQYENMAKQLMIIARRLEDLQREMQQRLRNPGG